MVLATSPAFISQLRSPMAPQRVSNPPITENSERRISSWVMDSETMQPVR